MVDDPKPEGEPNRGTPHPGPPHPLPHRRPSLSRRQLLAQVVVAAVILVSGVGIGAGGTILALKGRIIPRVRWMPTDPPGPEPNFIAARWKTEYGLSDKQEQQVRDALTKQFTSLRELRQKLFQAEQAERDKSTVSLKKILTSEQYAKWDQDMKKMAERFERMRAFRGQRGDHKGPPRGERGPGHPMDPNGRRWDGPPRPMMDGEGRRGGWPPHGPMDPNSRRRPDQAPNRPQEINARPADGNVPK